MANLYELRRQVEDVNAMGINNLSKKGVELSENATTCDIMKAISEINIGSGLGYQSIVYNKDDDTITLIDKYGGENVIACEFSYGKLAGVTYNKKPVDLIYIADMLDYIGKTKVDFTNAPIYGIEPLDHTVEFRLNNSPYEVASVKNGFSVNKPSIDPADQGAYRFNGWRIENEITGELEEGYMEFPYIPHRDIVAKAYFQRVREEMELKDALAFVVADKNGNTYYKRNEGLCIGGYSTLKNTSGSHCYVMLVAEKEEYCQMTPDSESYRKGTITYNGVTYYYCGVTATFGIQSVAPGISDTGYNPSYVDSGNAQYMAKAVLDKYFYVT